MIILISCYNFLTFRVAFSCCISEKITKNGDKVWKTKANKENRQSIEKSA